MGTRDLHEKGLKLRREIFGDEAVEQRTKAFGAFGEPLQNLINAYAYGDIWSRPALPLKMKSLAAIAMTAAIGRATELRVHLNGALTNGCTAEEIRDVLLLVALYCGIPALHIGGFWLRCRAFPHRNCFRIGPSELLAPGRSARRRRSVPPGATVTSRCRGTPRLAPRSGRLENTPLNEQGWANLYQPSCGSQYENSLSISS